MDRETDYEAVSTINVTDPQPATPVVRSCAAKTWTLMVLFAMRLLSILSCSVLLRVDNNSRGTLKIHQRSKIARGWWGRDVPSKSKEYFVIKSGETRFFLQNASMSVLYINSKILVYSWGIWKYCRVTVNSLTDLNNTSSLRLYNCVAEGKGPQAVDDLRMNGRAGMPSPKANNFEQRKQAVPNSIPSYDEDAADDDDQGGAMARIFETVVDLVNELAPLATIFTEQESLNMHNKVALLGVSIITMILNQSKPNLRYVYSLTDVYPLYKDDKVFGLTEYFIAPFIASAGGLVITNSNSGFDSVYKYFRIAYVATFMLLLHFRVALCVHAQGRAAVAVRALLFLLFATVFAAIMFVFYTEINELAIVGGYAIVAGVWIWLSAEANKLSYGCYNIYLFQFLRALCRTLVFAVSALSIASIIERVAKLWGAKKFELFIAFWVIVAIAASLCLAEFVF